MDLSNFEWCRKTAACEPWDTSARAPVETPIRLQERASEVPAATVELPTLIKSDVTAHAIKHCNRTKN